MAAGQKSSPQQQQEKNKDRKNIVFVHPDLGIGGAERWVIDAAVGLQGRGHRVAVLTSWRDKGHCFEEARDGEFFPPPIIPIIPSVTRVYKHVVLDI